MRRRDPLYIRWSVNISEEVTFTQVTTASLTAREEKGSIHVRQTQQHVQGPGGSMDHPMEEVKEDQGNGRKDQQEMWLKRWGGEGRIQQTHSPV